MSLGMWYEGVQYFYAKSKFVQSPNATVVTLKKPMERHVDVPSGRGTIVRGMERATVIEVATKGNAIRVEVIERGLQVLDVMCVASPLLLGQAMPMSNSEVVLTIPLLISPLARSLQLTAEGKKCTQRLVM